MIYKNIKGIQIEPASPLVEGSLDLRVSNLDLGFFGGKKIEVKGAISFEHPPICCDFIISLFDCTGGRLLPIQSISPEFQEEETSAFQSGCEINYEIGASLKFTKWTFIGAISKLTLNGPFKDSRNLMVVARLVDSEAESIILHGKALSTEGVLWTGIKKIKYDLEDEGYLESQIRLQRFHFLSIHLSMLIAAADGLVGEKKIEVIQDKIHNWLSKSSSYDQIYDGYFSDLKRSEGYIEQFNQAFQKARDGTLSESRLFTELTQTYTFSKIPELIGLCFDVMMADGKITVSALELIRKIARTGRIDPKRLTKIRDEKIVKMSTHSNLDIPIEQLLGVNPYWNRKKKINQLESEFHKWNSRLNMAPEGKTHENIQRLLNLIGNALKKYR